MFLLGHRKNRYPCQKRKLPCQALTRDLKAQSPADFPAPPVRMMYTVPTEKKNRAAPFSPGFGRPWLTMVDHGRPWSTHGRPWSNRFDPWSTMVAHGRPCSTMVDRSGPLSTWSPMVDYGRPWVDHDRPCSTILDMVDHVRPLVDCRNLCTVVSSTRTIYA